MRATINFEVDVDRVQEIMTALVLQEVVPLHNANELIEGVKPQQLHAGLASALENIHGVTRQLEQYRDMVASFEKARFETLLPQPSRGVGENMLQTPQSAHHIKQFEEFLEKINEGAPDDSEPEEG